jgi:cyclohexyl-isocyanide hydratase
MILAGDQLRIGAIIFPDMDQIDLTGPFEVLTRIPGSDFQLIWKELVPIRDVKGLVLTPNSTFAQCPQLDLLVVPGGPGQQQLMGDEGVLEFIRVQAAQVRFVFSVCTGALICGAAGLLRNVRATTHWTAHHLLPYFGAIPVGARVVVDGKLISAAGVTAGIDGALRVAALLRSDELSQQIQLAIEYAPEPPFASGTPQSAPSEVIAAVQASYKELAAARLATAQRFAERFNIQPV